MSYLQPSRDQVHHLTVALDGAAYNQQARVQHHPALALHHRGAHNQVDLTGLVFGDEIDCVHEAKSADAVREHACNGAFKLTIRLSAAMGNSPAKRLSD